MKKYILILTIAVAGLLVSCGDDFLALTPPGNIVAGGAVTRDIVDRNITSVYQILLFDDYAGGQWMPVNMFFDVMSDNFLSAGGGAGDQPHMYRSGRFETSSTQSAVTGWWSIYYSGLRRANEALHGLNSVRDNVPEAWFAERRAEVLTLRAWYTSLLWKAYGNIPYFTEPWSNPPFAARQHTRNEMYLLILEDLNAAINTPSSDFPMARARNGVDRGRVHKSMAMMVRARVILHMQDETRYAQILDDMKLIIAQPEFDLVTSIPNGATQFTGHQPNSNGIPRPTAATNHFEWIFLGQDPVVGMTGGGEFSTESVFEVASNTNQGKTWGDSWRGSGNYTPRFTSFRDNNNMAISNGRGNPGDANFVPAFDQRFVFGWGFMTVRPDAYAIFDANDLRRDVSVINFGQAPEYSWAGYQNTGLFNGKYAARRGNNVGTGGDRDLNWTNNRRIFRIAEAYLNLAELYARAGNTGAAQPYLDAVRSRAGLTSVPATFNAVKLERRKEFFGEGLRFWELLRWGSDENDRPLSTVFQSVSFPAGANGNPNVVSQDRFWTEYNRLLPIPNSNILQAADTPFPLEQNPGFID
ncbi:MAG: RagB/SusD family nutrient uptake outer membrane protein [Dysgonamonadaceae bacterium]|jgi:hypothetical protein|nr:RagB/SusD family nutrient uptake outer membrane protein [Dysgonamonadaceae bacterium]